MRMTETSAAFIPAPMEGHGGYNRGSRVQAAGASKAVPLFAGAANTVPLADAQETIVIADYGSSEGRNSLSPIAAAIRALRDRVGLERAISVVHTDLPDNDFQTLFQTLANDPDSYLRGDPAVFASAIGRSFYQQLLPSCSVTLGWSSWAVQWLSRTPSSIPDHVQVAYSHNAAARAAFTKQSADDWRTFLMSRGRELRPGGTLVVQTMALHDNGDFGYRGVLEAMCAALKSLCDEGFISAEELRRMTIPTVGRSRADIAAPFSPNGRFADLVMEHVEVFHGDDRIWREFERNRDAAEFGAQWATFSRASVFPTLARSLKGGPTDPRAPAFFGKLEAGMAARLSMAPGQMDIPLASVVLVKETAQARSTQASADSAANTGP